MDEPNDRETDRRRDEALARLLKMPPKPQEDMKLGKPRRKAAGTNPDRSQLGQKEDESRSPSQDGGNVHPGRH
jgi:hypothetical protein